MREKKTTILVVDDTETNIDILLDLLGNDYDLIVALNGESALEIVQEEPLDLILLDIMMPQMDGYEVCEILKANDKTKDIPVIFITAKTDEDSIEKAYEVGGIDYITKPFKPRELTARIKTQLNLKFLIEDLEFLASYDQMTGIYNRRKFFELAEKNFVFNTGDMYAVMIDIDKFKLINDIYGHPTGDAVIIKVTQIISEYLESDFIFGRLGGEEFAIMCNDQSLDEITKKLEFIRVAVSSFEMFSDNNEIIKCTISIGYARAKKETRNIDTLLKEADLALYEAKDSGRNRVVFRS
ncbi:MAG: diguanylate cyclase [Sulfurimonas sp.]|jgi:diguanylate cyclase (GGDEF)-like protein